MKRLSTLLVLALFLPSCCGLTRLMPTLFPPTATASFTPEPTSSPTLTATLTPRPTRTPRPASPSPAPTLQAAVLTTPTITTTALPELDCHLDWQSPGNGAVYKPLIEFSVGWKVTNTGTAAWTPDSVDFVYVSGARLYHYPLEHLKASVGPGQSVILGTEMRTPRNSTTYTSTWSLRRGDTYFCTLRVSIYVK